MQQYDETAKKETLLQFREGLAACGPQHCILLRPFEQQSETQVSLLLPPPVLRTSGKS